MEKVFNKMFICTVLLGFLLSLSSVLPSNSLAEKKHKQVSITFFAAPVGSNVYNFISAFSDIIRKNHPWIRFSVVETMGGVEMMKTIADSSPDRQKLFIANGVDAILNLAKIGKGPFGKSGKIDGWRIMFTMYNVAGGIVTLDPEIRSGKDLIGKRVGYPPKQHGLAKDADFALKNIWGVLDKVKVIYMPMDLQKDALLDGTVDAVVAGGMYFGENDFVVAPNIEIILAARKKVRFVGITKNEYAKAKPNLPPTPSTVQPVNANSVRPGFPDTVSGVWSQANNAYVWHNMDEETVYEIVKVLAENASKVKDYFATGKAFRLEGFVQNSWSPKRYHPGALRYYKEKGMMPQGTLN
ncbi:MAG: TAXI family TRAP transporter solute-binding subunit [Deltaproteobacteria bacterium]|nr:TAXI family TRAP transporter solute-binding subunit [Deltaproteobacteria bacterium]MBW1863238.1 TAXI family TRAP transporter solute-binding subunit [Deltaproteobacteria bacterium]